MIIQTSSKGSEKYLSPLYFLTIIILFTPQLQSYVGLAIEQLLSIVLIIISLFLLLTCYKGEFKLKHVSIIYIYMVLILISLLRGVNITGFIFRDIFELSKPLYLGITFILGFSIDWNELRIKKFFNFLICCFFMLSIFGLFEATTNIGNTIGHTLYKDLRGGVQYKAVASFISPYVFASVLMIPFFYFLALSFSKIKIKYIMLVLFFFLVILLTQSRTILISLVLSLMFIFLFNLCSNAYSGKRKVNIFIILLLVTVFILSPIIISVVEENFKYIYSGFNVVFSNITDIEMLIYSTPSISNRYEQMIFVIEHIDTIPIIGANIGKELVNPESFYALYLYRVGLLGVSLHFMLIIYVFFKSKYIAFKSKHDIYINSIFISITFYTISIPFSYASSALNDQVRSGFVFYMLSGMVFKFYYILRKNENINRNLNFR